MGKYAAIFRISLRSASAYLGDVAGRTGFFILILFVLSQVWGKLLKGQQAAGFGPSDLVWYLVFTESLLLAVPHFESTMEEEVRSGAVAYLMVRPVNYLGHHLASFAGEVFIRLAMNLLVGAPFALLLGGLPPTPIAGVPWALAAAALGLTLHFHIIACMALLAFWLEETRPFFWIYQKILFTAGGLMIPLEFFPGWLKGVIQSLPFASVLYAPARLGVRFSPEAAVGLIRTQILWVIFFVILSHGIYGRASRQLQVNGG